VLLAEELAWRRLSAPAALRAGRVESRRETLSKPDPQTKKMLQQRVRFFARSSMHCFTPAPQSRSTLVGQWLLDEIVAEVASEILPEGEKAALFLSKMILPVCCPVSIQRWASAACSRGKGAVDDRANLSTSEQWPHFLLNASPPAKAFAWTGPQVEREHPEWRRSG
jgi:hypothetical protein